MGAAGSSNCEVSEYSMGKKGFPSVGKRRTVLQLDDEAPRKQPTYGFGYKPADNAPPSNGSANALSGLMSHYAQDSASGSDSDDDSNPPSVDTDVTGQVNWSSSSTSSKMHLQKFVAASETLPSNVNQPEPSVVKTESLPKSEAKPVEDMDIKLQDFLAEIESIETKTDGDIDGLPLESETQPVKAGFKLLSSETSEAVVASDDDADFKLSKPKEPISQWQQCLDEASQCYYYWNFDTNEVTWEIPAEYSQYLLLYAEYEKARVIYETELAEWKKHHPNRKPHRTSKKKHRKHAKNDSDVCIPIVSYPPDDDDDDSAVEQGPSLPIIGPTLPEKSATVADSTEDLVAIEIPANPMNSFLDKAYIEVQHPSRSGKSSKTKTASKTDETNDGSTREMNQHVQESDVLQQGSAASLGSSKIKSLREKYIKRSGLGQADERTVHRDDSRESSVSDDQVIAVHNQVGEVAAATSSVSQPVDKRPDEIVPVIADAEKNEVEDEEDYDRYAEQMLEEPVFERYEYINKKYDVTVPHEESDHHRRDVMDLPLSEISLRMASADDVSSSSGLTFDHKQHSQFLSSAPTYESGFSKARRKDKRKVANQLDNGVPLKKPKTGNESGGSFVQSVTHDDIKRKVDELSEVAEMASTVMDKLDFLEVTTSGMSQLQVLLVQIQTRIDDWRAGALSTDHLHSKLRESCSTLCQYEMTATPPGWSCIWHRSYKRYYYRHDITGQTRWDYPEGDDTDSTPRDQQVSPPPLPPPLPAQEEPNQNFAQERPLTPVEATFSGRTHCSNTDDGSLVSNVDRNCTQAPSSSFTNSSADDDEPANEPLSGTFHPDEPPPSGTYHPDEPPPPGTECSIQHRLPRMNLSSLASCPPPPPPATPPSQSYPADGVQDDGDVVLDDGIVRSNSPVRSLPAAEAFEGDFDGNFDANGIPEEDFTRKSIPAGVPSVISAPPVLNRPHSFADVTSSGFYTASSGVMSPVTDGVDDGSGSTYVDQQRAAPVGPSHDSAPVSDASSAGHGKEKRKKKEKVSTALVGGGLALKKKKVTSLVEKWQKVQQVVTEEVNKEEEKMRLKKLAASSSSSNGSGTTHE